ncbi:hypothetical protein JNW87_14430, partial [Micromonospora sp. ATA51]|nr:hypothetical protein [Micromonospora sp. ATA51]
RLWNEVFTFAQQRLGIAHGTIRATVLIETMPAALDRPADLPAAAAGGSVSYRRTGGLRGRPYQSGRGSHSA